MTIRARGRVGWIIQACLVPALAATGGAATFAAAADRLLPERSAGVFIGVEEFSHDLRLTDVVFAANDAVDLAYALSIERGLLPANRVLLLLSGEPRGPSHDRLQVLLTAGAKRQTARLADIYMLVEEQSRLVGEGGILLLFAATHGYSDGNVHLLIPEDGLVRYGTGVTAQRLLEAMQVSEGALRLLFVDACRDQLFRTRGTGTPREADSRSVMRHERIEALAKPAGYIVFSAASEGEVAGTSDRNGWFTAALVEGLRCDRLGRGQRSFRELTSFVTARVRKQSAGLQNPELRMGGGSADFVIPSCGFRQSPPSPTVPPDALPVIEEAMRLRAVGGIQNLEQSFRLYQRVFQRLAPEILATLNQALVARARQLADGSRAEAVRIYSELLDPLVAP